MSELDIRKGKLIQLEYIRFADVSDDEYKATRICKGDCGRISIEEDDISNPNPQDVSIVSVEHAKNLIVALEKAIELGWLNK